MASVKTPTPKSLDELEEMCGEVIKQTLERYTDGIIVHAQGLIPSVLDVARALRAALLEMYPHRRPIYFAEETEVWK
jgi:hypothetical protein